MESTNETPSETTPLGLRLAIFFSAIVFCCLILGNLLRIDAATARIDGTAVTIVDPATTPGTDRREAPAP